MTYPRRIVALDLETSDKNKAYGYIKQIACRSEEHTSELQSQR